MQRIPLAQCHIIDWGSWESRCILCPACRATHLQASSVRPPATQAALKASATAVAFVTACWESANCCIARKHCLQIAQGVGPHLPSCSQVSIPVVSSHTQRLVVTVFVHMRSVELQSGDVLQPVGSNDKASWKDAACVGALCCAKAEVAPGDIWYCWGAAGYCRKVAKVPCWLKACMTVPAPAEDAWVRWQLCKQLISTLWRLFGPAQNLVNCCYSLQDSLHNQTYQLMLPNFRVNTLLQQ